MLESVGAKPMDREGRLYLHHSPWKWDLSCGAGQMSPGESGDQSGTALISWDKGLFSEFLFNEGLFLFVCIENW